VISGPIAQSMGTANLFLGCGLSGVIALTLFWFFTSIRYVEKMDEVSVEFKALAVPKLAQKKTQATA